MLKKIIPILFLFAAFQSSAAIIEYSFEATVSAVQGVSSTVISAGDKANATFLYDSLGSSSSSGSGVQKNYQFTDFDLNLTVEHDSGGTINSYTGTSGAGTISIINDWGSNGDWFQIRTQPGNVTSDPITGRSISQMDMTLKQKDGSLYPDTSLPNFISDLNSFDEAFFTVYLDGLYAFNIDIDRIETSSSTTLAEETITNEATEILAPLGELNGAGGLIIDMPDSLIGVIDVEAQFSQQPLSEYFSDPDPDITFAIPGYSLDVGETLQIWDIDIDNTLIPDGELVEISLTYDDTGMSTFEELGLDVFHVLSDGSIEILERIGLDTQLNTITVLTPGFSDVGIMANLAPRSSVPEPSIIALFAAGLFGIGFARRRQS